ncbi:unnamed protein product [Sphagnum jensenii]|uniref:Uncharacterized protein n=1 Tax=Sphagnum jensenii TaxID=128206 RepID=A0ABP0WTW8_9BRYO
MVRVLIDVVAESPFGEPQAGVAAGPPSVNVMAGLRLLLPSIGIVVAIVYSLYRSRRSLPASATLTSIPSSTSSTGSTEHVTASTANEEAGTPSTTVAQEFLQAGTSIINTEISASANNETVSASTSVTNASVATILTAANSVVQAVLYFILSS